jgi:16S rRNA A1518/A1519 N6-dimethyltransferase RsmA/KsgA/DIM1 with predicted DNA glycosylase/AP lyase activity
MKAFLFILFLLFELLILILINFYLISLFISHFWGAPYVPTRKKVTDQILAKIKPKKNQFFYELGCGDGRVVKRAVEKYRLIGVGIDINPFLIIFLKFQSFIFRRKNPKFIYRDMLKVDLSKADYVYCFLMPSLLEKLQKKFDRELRKNTIIISHGFKIPKQEKNLYFILQNKPFNTYFYKKH